MYVCCSLGSVYEASCRLSVAGVTSLALIPALGFCSKLGLAHGEAGLMLGLPAAW